jgi:DNA repair protein RadA/Sms
MSIGKSRTTFFCGTCGGETPRWEGRCPACGEWNTLVEAPREVRGGRRSPGTAGDGAVAQQLSDLSADATPRIPLRSPETARVLGGGIVPGSVVLIAGDPGIGKSTLLLGLAADVSTRAETLYVSGEESPVQVKMRADRLGISGRDIYVLASTDLETVLQRLDQQRPAMVLVDSIQTIRTEHLASEGGTIGQIKESARRLAVWAKANGTPVLYMEGDPVSSWRLLRTYKNRFGSTNEVGVFEMTETGLSDVEDPSHLFTSANRSGSVGSVIVSVMEGSRPMLVEVQALTVPSPLPSPRRVATGVDPNRLLLVCAVLTRRAGIPLANQDVIVNVTGGLRITEPAADLGLALAVASNHLDAPVDPGVVAIGEIGLGGEIRRVPQLDRRVNEAGRLGLDRCLVPEEAEREQGLSRDGGHVPVSTVRQAIGEALAAGNGGR